MLNLFGVVVFHTSMVNWSGGVGTSALSICAFCYMCNSFSVMVLHRSLVIWRMGDLAICEFCYLLNFFV